MRRWLGPALFGIAVTAVAAWIAIIWIPHGLMTVAMDRLGQGGINRIPIFPWNGRTVAIPFWPCPGEILRPHLHHGTAKFGAPVMEIVISHERTSGQR